MTFEISSEQLFQNSNSIHRNCSGWTRNRWPTVGGPRPNTRLTAKDRRRLSRGPGWQERVPRSSHRWPRSETGITTSATRLIPRYSITWFIRVYCTVTDSRPVRNIWITYSCYSRRHVEGMILDRSIKTWGEWVHTHLILLLSRTMHVL